MAERNHQLAVRFTDDEWEKLGDIAAASGTARAEVLRAGISSVRLIDKKSIASLRLAITKIGTNINRLALKANQAGHSSAIYAAALGDLDDLKALIVKVTGK